MTSKSLRKFAGATINADDLFERYKIACDLKQPVDHDKIMLALHRWADKIGIPDVPIKFVTTAKEVEVAVSAARAAWDARAAWAAWAVSAARVVSAVSAARAVSAVSAVSAAWAARAAWAAWDAWAAKDAWDVSYISIAAIGASSEGEQETLEKWLPIFEAFEAGAFSLWVGKDIIYVAVIPTKVLVDDQRRLHCENGPAFVWLDDIRDYYWQGVNVPEAWITNPASIEAKVALSESNMERRRAACALIPGGWETILKELEAKTIDLDGDPQIGELVEVGLPGQGKEKLKVRYLRVQCGTGRKFAVCVPPDTKTALDAQAWMLGLPTEKFVRPEIRT